MLLGRHKFPEELEDDVKREEEFVDVPCLGKLCVRCASDGGFGGGEALNLVKVRWLGSIGLKIYER
jgi:hypothetical protein